MTVTAAPAVPLPGPLPVKGPLVLASVEAAPARLLARRWSLTLRFTRDGEPAPPPEVKLRDVEMRTVKGTRTPDLVPLSVRETAEVLTVEIIDKRPSQSVEGDPPAYVVAIVGLPPLVLDPRKASGGFVLTGPLIQSTDCGAITLTPQPPAEAGPEIDYTARDFPAIREMLLDQIRLLAPEWKENSPADPLITIVEALAYGADLLNYYQDAVATEAYLATSRQRESVRRHTRLVDYTLSEGCNSRVWVWIVVNGPGALELPAKTPIVASDVPQHAIELGAVPSLERAGALVFETMLPATLYPELNRLSFAVPAGAADLVLPIGTIAATLRGRIGNLHAQDVLVLQEERDPRTGRTEDADPSHRIAVRLISVILGDDTTDITWNDEDALPWPLWVRSSATGVAEGDCSVALGNIVLADHGRSVTDPDLAAAHLLRLSQPNPTFAAPLPPLPDRLPASEIVRQEPSLVRPIIALTQTGGALAQQGFAAAGLGLQWQARNDLLESAPFGRDFVVEIGADRSASLRFGDGVLGLAPPANAHFHADYRVGNGIAGNIGANTSLAVALDFGDPRAPRIESAENPLPASGGREPESIASAKLDAPQAWLGQERAVTPADYAAVARRHPDVRNAAAREVPAPPLQTAVEIAIQPRVPVDERDLASIALFIDRFRTIGTSFTVRLPSYVPLDIQLVAYASPGVSASAVRIGLERAFGARLQPNGVPGYFYPGRFTFGQPVYLSDIVRYALGVPGVSWIDVDPRSDPRIVFRRMDLFTPVSIDAGVIAIEPLEIARADTRPADPFFDGLVRFFVVVDP